MEITINVSISYLKPRVTSCFTFLSPAMRVTAHASAVLFVFLKSFVSCWGCFGFANDQHPSFHSVFESKHSGFSTFRF